VYPQPQSWPIGTDPAARNRTLQHVSRRATSHVVIRVGCERTTVAGDFHDFDAGSRGHLGFDSVTWTF
jgi:hypothetical protein